MIILNNLFPVFAIIALGSLARQAKLVSKSFLEIADRLVYFLFFPALLFWKIGQTPPTDLAVNGHLLLAAAGAVITIYVLSLAYILVFKVEAFKAGTFSQTCYRFNTYVGLAVILTYYGESALAIFGVLISLIIPLINVLAVGTLTWFARTGHSQNKRSRAGMIKTIVSNPLIIGCLAGIAYSHAFGVFPVFLDNTFRLGAGLTLPLALLSIGGNLTFGTLRDNLGLAVAASAFKLLLLPLAGFAWMHMLNVEGLAFGTGTIFFCLPTATTIQVLSSQLDSDTHLASAAIVVSTLFSILSLSTALELLHY